MAVFLHRAFDPAGNEFRYWQAEELDLGGTNYVGPPAFETLENPVLLRKYLTAAGIRYDVEEGQVDTVTEYEEVT